MFLDKCEVFIYDGLEINEVSYTCAMARLHCDDSGFFAALVTDFNKKYDDLRVKTNECFDQTFIFIDPFLKLLYHTHHRTMQTMTSIKSYPIFIDMSYPFEAWRQGC